MTGRLRRRLLVGAALAFVVAAALVLGLFPQEPLRRLAERRLAEALGATVRVARLRVVPGALRVLAEGVAIEGQTFRAEVRRVDLTLHRQTLGGALALRRLEADGLRVTATSSAAAAAKPAPLPPIRVDAIELRDAEIVYSAPELGTLRLEGISARGAVGREALEVTLTKGVLERPRPLPFSGQARLAVGSDLDVTVEELRLQTPRSVVEARGRLGRLTSPVPELDVEASADLGEAGGLAGLDGMAGAVSLTAHIARQVQVHAEGRGIEIAGRRLTTAAVAINHDEKATTFRASAGLLGGSLESDGRLAGGRLSAHVRFHELKLATLARTSGEASLAGDPARTLQVAATFETSGSDGGIEVQGAGLVRGSVTTRAQALDLEWSLRLDGHGPLLPELTAEAKGTAHGPWPSALSGAGAGRMVVRGPEGPIDASFDAAIRGQGSTLEVELRGSGAGGALASRLELAGGALARVSGEGSGFDLARLASGAVGTAGLRFDVRDPLGEHAAGQARLAVSGGAFQGAEFGEASLDATFERGRLAAVLLAPALKLRAEAMLPPGNRRRLEGAVELDGTPLDPFARAFGRPELKGTATGHARFELPPDAPRAGILEVERLALSSAGTELAISGTFGVTPDAPLRIRADGTAELAAAPVPEGLTLAGRAAVRLLLTGTLQAPALEGTLRLEEIEGSGAAFPAFGVESALLRFERDRVVLAEPVYARIAGGRLSVSGEAPFAAFVTRLRRGPLAESQRGRLRVSWSGIEATALHPSTGAAASWAATLSGEATIESGFAAIGELRAAASAAVADARAGDLQIAVSPFELSLERGRISSPKIEVNAAGATLVATGFRDLVSGDQDLGATGSLDLRALAPLLEEMSVGGTAVVDVRYAGKTSEPRASGTIRIADATLRHRSHPQALTSLNALVTLDDNGLRLSDAAAVFGGGTLTASGGTAFARGRPAEIGVSLKGSDMTLRYPEGLRSHVDADLRLLGTPTALRLEGDVRARGGSYDLDTLLKATATPTPEPSVALRRMVLDLRVTAEDPILVRNDLARIEATAQLSIRGDLETPEPYGRLELTPGGRVKLASRDFLIESGTVTYPGSWNASLSIRARGRVRNAEELRDYDVTIALGGTTEDAELRFSSDPPESEARIVSLLTTGRFRADAFESGGRAVGDQLAGLFASRLTRGLAGGIGLDEISIQPELLSRETEPGARFTFGKRLADRGRLIQSWSLNDPEGRFTQIEATPGRDVALTLQRRDDGSFTGGAGQRLRFGGPALRGARPEERVRISEVEFAGSRPLPEAELRRMLGVEPGDRIAPSSLQDTADKLRERFIEAGYLEAEVGARLVEGRALVTLSAGPLIVWRIAGASKPAGFDRTLRESQSAEGALEVGRELLLEQERGRAHLSAEVAASAHDEDGQRVLLFEVRPGSVVEAQVEFPGASGLSKAELLEAAGGPAALLTAPGAAAAALRDAYRTAFFLAAEVGDPDIVEQGPHVRIVVPIREGPRARIREVLVRGSAFPEQDVRRGLGLGPGDAYDEALAARAAVQLRLKHLGAGYPDARVARSIELAGTDLDLIFEVSAGERFTIGEIRIEGARRTRLALVEDRLQFKPGDPLDVRALTRAEQRLLEIGAFSRAVVSWTREQPARVHVALTEDARFLTGYEVRYNDQEGGGLQLDTEARNLLGRAVSLGARYRLGTKQDELRASLHVPSAFRVGDLILSAFRSYEELETLGDVPDIRRERGVQVQQALRFRSRWNFLYGYRFRRVTIESPFLLIPITENIAALEASVVREGRDNPINARHGRFLSFNVERAGLGSDFKFLKTFAQAFFNRPLGPNLTWSHGYRLGLGWGRAGQRVVLPERFQAGGANSMRPYADDSLGPRDVLGQVTGGEALVILNQELRIHHPSGLGAALFYDGGNVFDRVQDVSLDLRHGAGLGVRYDSPFGLLRVDVGFPFDRRPGEDAYQLYFSLGQAF